MKRIEDNVYVAESWLDLQEKLFDFKPGEKHG